MKVIYRLGLLSLCIFLFQNCGEFSGTGIEINYPYSSQPDFFYDIKLVSVETDDLGLKRFDFDVAISFASNINQAVSYRLAFSTLNRSRVCLSVDATADGSEKHDRYTCILPTPDDLYVQITLLGPTGEEVVEQFRF